MIAVGQTLTLDALAEVASGVARVRLSEEGVARMARAEEIVKRVVAEAGAAVYGVNTGFGALAEIRVPEHELERLQLNLLRSHAVGVGAPFGEETVRAMMLLRAQVLAQGYSGVRREVVALLVAMLNAGVVPVIPELGSVGACGDLAPLAHLALVLVGEGEAWYGGARMSGREALGAAGLEPLVRLAPKEGLSLINGTAALTAVGALAHVKALRLAEAADLTGAMSLEALNGSVRPFDEEVVGARPHPGALQVAANLRQILAGSEIVQAHAGCREVQDAYSLRCMPQVHGSARELLAYAGGVLEVEINAATDNPLVLEDGRVVSGGNFHGQPVAAAYDVAALAVVDLMSISERRVAKLIDASRSRGLPPFLAVHSGLESGFMMAHVTVAALVAEARALATPRSVDSIPTSADREDHVPMGMGAALNYEKIVSLAGWVLGIEAVVAGHGVELRGLTPGAGVRRALAKLREVVSPHVGDRAMSQDFEAAKALVLSGELLGETGAAGRR